MRCVVVGLKLADLISAIFTLSTKTLFFLTGGTSVCTRLPFKLCALFEAIIEYFANTF